MLFKNEIYIKSFRKSMKWFLLLSTIYILLTGCSFTTKPEFKYIDHIEVKNISLRNVTIQADAVFNNPNHLKGKLTLEDVHIFVDNMDVGVVKASEFDVPAKGEFSIPLKGTFSLSQIYNENKKNLLGNILKAIQTDSITINYRGTIRYRLGSFSYPYKIDKTEKIAIQ